MTVKMHRYDCNRGQKVKYHHDLIGVNSRLDTLQAAILNVKLKYLDEYTAKRRAVAAQYTKAFAGIDQLAIPVQVPYSTHAFNQYTLRLKGGSRDEFKSFLNKEGIPTMIYYPLPLHFQKAFRRPGVGEGSFPVTEKLSKVLISLPIHTEMSQDQVDFICNRVTHYFQ